MIVKAGLVALFVVAVYFMIASCGNDSMNDQPETVSCDEVKSLAADAALKGGDPTLYDPMLRRYC